MEFRVFGCLIREPNEPRIGAPVFRRPPGRGPGKKQPPSCLIAITSKSGGKARRKRNASGPRRRFVSLPPEPVQPIDSRFRSLRRPVFVHRRRASGQLALLADHPEGEYGEDQGGKNNGGEKQKICCDDLGVSWESEPQAAAILAFRSEVVTKMSCGAG